MMGLFPEKATICSRLFILAAFSILLLSACGGGDGDGNVIGQGGSVIPPQGTPDLGVNASLQGARPFPDDNPWNTPVAEGNAIRHALRFTASRTRRAYVYPARHFASSSTDPSLPPMGMRVRLKAGVDISGYPPSARVILQALKTYGMILADNGSSWYVSGAPDSRWNDDELSTMKSLSGNDFEVVKMGPPATQ